MSRATDALPFGSRLTSVRTDSAVDAVALHFVPLPTMPTNKLPRRVFRLALLAPLSLAFAGCNTSESDGKPKTAAATDDCAECCAPATKPAHGGVMSNNTNKPMPGKPSSGVLGKVERLDPGLDALLSQAAQMEKFVEGLDWSEGPVWDSKNNCLYFSDVPQNVVYKWDGKALTEHLRPSGYTGTDPRGGEPGSNGLTMRDGVLYLCQHGDRRVAKWDAAEKKFVTVTDKHDGKRYNSPNDLCFDRAGNLFFTDPPYGLPKNVDDPTKEIPYQGVYRMSPDGKVTLLTKEMTRPNGVALSPDEKTLYVANSDPKLAIWKSFPINADGTLGDGKVFFDATAMVGKVKGLPDGLKVDAKGNLWATGPGGVLIFSPDGKHLGTLATGEATANVAFGDDGSTLYICADMYMAKIKTNVKGW